jgi:hypothetical protein
MLVELAVFEIIYTKILISSFHAGKRNIIDCTQTIKKVIYGKKIVSNMTKHWDIHVSPDMLFRRLFIASIDFEIIFHVNLNSYTAGLGAVDSQYRLIFWT